MDVFFEPLKMLTLVAALLMYASPLVAEQADHRSDDIEIVHGADRTIFEYSQNGVLRIIKIVPKKGRPYYLIPVDANPHFEGLDHAKKLYPQWIIVEW